MCRTVAVDHTHLLWWNWLKLVSLVALLCVPLYAIADQNDPELVELYNSLSAAPDAATAGEIESAIWQKWLEAPDGKSNDLLMKTTAAMRESNFRQALAYATELVDAYPDYAEAWNKRATVYYLLGNFDSSVSDIYETLRREPRHFGAISGLGLIFQRKGDLEGALAAFEQVLEISPQSINARRNAELIKQELGDEI